MFEDIYDRQFDRVYRVAYLMLKNKEEAEDALQTVFLKYLNSDVTFKDSEHEKAWFITVTKNTCKDIIKSAWKTRVDLPGEYETTSQHENEDSLISYILELPEKYREVLYLYYYEGYKAKEIARYIDSNESTVLSRLKSAREHLKSLLESEGSIYA